MSDFDSANLASKLEALEEQNKVVAEQLDKRLSAQTSKLEGQDTTIAVLKEELAGLKGRIDELERHNRALQSELVEQSHRVGEAIDWILLSDEQEKKLKTSILRREGIEQVQSELALRAGLLESRTSSSQDAAIWRAALAQKSETDDDVGRLNAGKALLAKALEEDTAGDLKRLVESDGMRLLTQKNRRF